MPHLTCMAAFRAFIRLLRWIALFVPVLCGAQDCPPEPAALTPPQLFALMKEAKDHGFLWKIEKEGRIGHLYGSIHLGKQAWMMPGPKVMAALTASDTVALELDILDPAIQAQMADLTRLGIEPITLPPALQARMDVAARKVCAPQAALAKLHPIMQLVTITVLEARFSDLEAAYGSEIFLAGFARGSGKQVASLETVEAQMRALMQGEPKEVIDGVDRALALMEKGRTRPVTERLVSAWAGGNFEELQNYTQWCECAETPAERRALARLNDDRNPALAAGIDKLVRGGKNVFAAVGALHMVGPKAVPQLLREMGYRVERIRFDH